MSPLAWENTGDGHDSAHTRPDHLSTDLHTLFKLLHDRKIPHLRVGGVALLKYIDGRNTEDIDLVLFVASLAALPEITIHERNADFVRGRLRSVVVDLRLTSNPVSKLAQEQYATTHRFGEFEVPCATVEGLVLLKLYALPDLYAAGRLQRALLYENDVAMLCQKHRPDTGRLLTVLEPHVPHGAMEELRKIVAEIEVKIARMGGR